MIVWIEGAVRESLHALLVELGFRPTATTADALLETVRYTGAVEFSVNYDVRGEFVSVLILLGGPTDIVELDQLRTGLRLPPITDRRIQYGDVKTLQDVLNDVASSFELPEMRSILSGDRETYEAVLAASAPGPSVPRYLWPDPFLGAPSLRAKQSESEKG